MAKAGCMLNKFPLTETCLIVLRFILRMKSFWKLLRSQKARFHLCGIVLVLITARYEKESYCYMWLQIKPIKFTKSIIWYPLLKQHLVWVLMTVSDKTPPSAWLQRFLYKHWHKLPRGRANPDLFYRNKGIKLKCSHWVSRVHKYAPMDWQHLLHSAPGKLPSSQNYVQIHSHICHF